MENAIEQDLSIVDETPLLLIGRQVAAWGVTSSNKYIDLLCIDADGNLVVMELKRDKTPREVVAQTLDYGAWLETLSLADVKNIFVDKHPGQSFEAAFETRFPDAPQLESLGEAPRLLIVAARLDAETERILSYLTRSFGVPINAVLFSYFKDGQSEFLARTWLLDSNATEATSEKTVRHSTKSGEVWNGQDFYVNLGENEHRNWDDCIKYGFLCAGGGTWFSNSLRRLQPGHRVFAYLVGDVAKTGYVGVGTVVETVVPILEFRVEIDGQNVLLANVANLKAPGISHDAQDEILREYVVRVKWEKTLPREDAYRESGMFYGRNTVCKLKNAFTLEKLRQHFQLGEEAAPSVSSTVTF